MTQGGDARDGLWTLTAEEARSRSPVQMGPSQRDSGLARISEDGMVCVDRWSERRRTEFDFETDTGTLGTGHIQHGQTRDRENAGAVESIVRGFA